MDIETKKEVKELIEESFLRFGREYTNEIEDKIYYSRGEKQKQYIDELRKKVELHKKSIANFDEKCKKENKAKERAEKFQKVYNVFYVLNIIVDILLLIFCLPLGLLCIFCTAVINTEKKRK